MRREIPVFGTLVPSLLPYFLAALVLFVVTDRLLSVIGLYRGAWHPPLARCGLFLIVFSSLVLLGGGR
jgi:hypothetical protein